MNVNPTMPTASLYMRKDSKLLRNVIGRNVAAVLDIVEELVMQGRELTQLVGDFTWYLRNLLLVKTSDSFFIFFAAFFILENSFLS